MQQPTVVQGLSPGSLISDQSPNYRSLHPLVKTNVKGSLQKSAKAKTRYVKLKEGKGGYLQMFFTHKQLGGI